MYQPAHGKFVVDNASDLLAQLAAHVPATLVTATHDGGLRASMLPMLFDRDAGAHGVLRGHLALQNEQWRDARGDADVIAIFNGPDAYITPAWYEEKRRTGRVVPTWNYTTVVVHGRLSAHEDPGWLLSHVRELVGRHEQPRPEPWSIDDAPPAYLHGQLRGIVGLELVIERIDAKAKLSQNRPAADIRATIAGLEEGGPSERAVALDMRAMIPAATDDTDGTLAEADGFSDESTSRSRPPIA